MNWNRRITIAREKQGINKSEFARRVGVSTATTADWESGTIKMIDGRNLVKVSAVLNVRPEWLMNGSGLMDAEDEEGAVVREFDRIYRSVTTEGQSFLKGSLAAAESAFSKTKGGSRSA